MTGHPNARPAAGGPVLPDPVLLFVHGWGFTARLWDGVRAALGDADGIAVDFGFFGPPQSIGPDLASSGRPPPGRPVIAIGHSFGLLWLLRHRPADLTGLVAINGFPRFTAAADYDPAVAPRLLDRMIRRFDQGPDATVAEFHQRCGLPAAAVPPAPVVPDRAGAALRALRDWDARADLAALSCPVLVLAGGQDPVVTPAQSAHAFAAARSATLVWHTSGGHLLPLSDPAWCAAQIDAFRARLCPPPASP